jgi:hypothetical protein
MQSTHLFSPKRLNIMPHDIGNLIFISLQRITSIVIFFNFFGFLIIAKAVRLFFLSQTSRISASTWTAEK